MIKEDSQILFYYVCIDLNNLKGKPVVVDGEIICVFYLLPDA